MKVEKYVGNKGRGNMMESVRHLMSSPLRSHVSLSLKTFSPPLHFNTRQVRLNMFENVFTMQKRETERERVRERVRHRESETVNARNN